MPGMNKTMHEFRKGTLHSGSKSGPKVTSRKQAIAIGLNQARKGAAPAPGNDVSQRPSISALDR